MFKLLYNLWLFGFRFCNSNNFFSRNVAFFSKNFESISFFKKLFVIFFHDDISNKNLNVINYRRKNFPLIHTFHVSLYNKRVKSNVSLKQFNKEVNFIRANLNENNTIKNLFSQNEVFNLYFLQKLFSKHFYTFFEDNSSVKINFLMSQIIDANSNALNSYKLYNLNFYSHWYKYNFDNNRFIFPQLGLNKIHTFFNISPKKSNFNFYLNTDLRNISLVEINKSFTEKLSSLLPINFSESSTNKYINLDNVKNYCFFFLRKNKIFNKGRYSRNRQLYRTGFYWCLYFNVICVYGLYFLFYRVVFNFGYIWLFLIVFFGSFVFSRMLKYNFFNINFVTNEIVKSFNWLSLMLSNLLSFYDIFINAFFDKINKLSSNSSLFGLRFSNLSSTLKFFSLSRDLFKFSFFWKSMNSHDSSVLKVNSIIHYLTQLPFFFKNK